MPVTGVGAVMKTNEYWIWRYRDPTSGAVRRTKFPLSAAEVALLYPNAERIEGTMTLRELYDDGRDTVPGIFRHAGFTGRESAAVFDR